MRQIFLYSLHDQTVSQFRRMMTLEQFRSPELAALYSKRYVDRMIAYHAGIFRALISAGELPDEDPETMAWMYVSPVITLLAVCDRQPEREKGGEWAIIHRCKRCGKLSSNRVAADDNPMKLMSIAMKPLCEPPFPLDYIEEMTALMGGDGRMK